MGSTGWVKKILSFSLTQLSDPPGYWPTYTVLRQCSRCPEAQFFTAKPVPKSDRGPHSDGVCIRLVMQSIKNMLGSSFTPKSEGIRSYILLKKKKKRKKEGNF